jgi:hypothetical protein
MLILSQKLFGFRNQWLYFPPSRSLHIQQKNKKTADHRPLDKKSLETTAGKR